MPNTQSIQQTAHDSISLANAPEWLQNLRRKGFETFEQLGYPKKKDEEWRYIDLEPVFEEDFKFAETPAQQAQEDISQAYLTELREQNCPTLVFVDGFLSPALCNLPENNQGIQLLSLQQVLRELKAESTSSLNEDLQEVLSLVGTTPEIFSHGFLARNASLAQDGIIIKISDEVIEPIYILYYYTGEAQKEACIRNVWWLDSGARATIVEEFASESLNLENIVTETAVNENARLDHFRFFPPNFKNYHFSTTHVQQAADSYYGCHQLALGGELVRNEIRSYINSENAHTDLDGLLALDHEDYVENQTAVHHLVPYTTSDELYHHILGGEAKSVFRGFVHVKAEAQKTDAGQTNRTLLLSDDAEIATKPQLEIYADDVQCGHGATIGQLDQEAERYLRSRGLSVQEARKLLLQAFAEQIFERWEELPAQQILHQAFDRALDNSRLLKS